MSDGATTKALRLRAFYEAVPESVGQARRALAAFAELHGAGEEDLQRIKLAVSEALSNAVVHAYGGRSAGIVDLSALAGEGELRVLIADEGCGIGGARRSEGLGLGLAVMTQLCDSLRVITTSAGGTRVEMRFRLAHAAVAGGLGGRGVGARAVG
jgi:anti-sigma regulatory factor (Ser/Thr protein kinase)